MRKSILLLLILLAVAGITNAQDTTSTQPDQEKRKGYIGLLFGPSFPVGDYGDSDLMSNGEAGLAKTGFSLFLVDFGYNFHPNIGIAASWFGGTNPLEANKLEEYYENTDQLGGDWEISSGNYGYGGLFVGPMFTVPFNKMELDLKVTGGYASGILPEVKYYGLVNGTTFNFIQESASGSSFGLAVGAGARIPISKKFNGMIRVEYIMMEPEVEVVLKQGDFFNGYTEIGREKVKQQMNTLNVLFGFSYRLK